MPRQVMLEKQPTWVPSYLFVELIFCIWSEACSIGMALCKKGTNLVAGLKVLFLYAQHRVHKSDTNLLSVMASHAKHVEIGAWRAKREIVSFRVVRACARCLCEVRSG